MPAGPVTPNAPRRWNKVGIIAGGGDLPAKLADACIRQGADYHVIGLAGYADASLAEYGAAECGIAEFGRLLRLLKQAKCDAIVFVGYVRRPNFSTLRPDWRGAALLPKVINAARRGDGAMLDLLVDTFAAEGFMVLGAEDVAGGLATSAGALGRHAPTEEDFADMQKAAAVIDALGPFDIGQGAVVRGGFVLAVEAAEGTDEMLRRCAPIVSNLNEGGDVVASGVLLKRPKPGQELRVDLPTVGVRTVDLAAEAHLNGIAIEAGLSLIVDADAVRQRADERGIFVYAFEAGSLARSS